jgi:hypothetical protein
VLTWRPHRRHTASSCPCGSPHGYWGGDHKRSGRDLVWLSVVQANGWSSQGWLGVKHPADPVRHGTVQTNVWLRWDRLDAKDPWGSGVSCYGVVGCVPQSPAQGFGMPASCSTGSSKGAAGRQELAGGEVFQRLDNKRLSAVSWFLRIGFRRRLTWPWAGCRPQGGGNQSRNMTGQDDAITWTRSPDSCKVRKGGGLIERMPRWRQPTARQDRSGADG